MKKDQLNLFLKELRKDVKRRDYFIFYRRRIAIQREKHELRVEQLSHSSRTSQNKLKSNFDRLSLALQIKKSRLQI